MKHKSFCTLYVCMLIGLLNCTSTLQGQNMEMVDLSGGYTTDGYLVKGGFSKLYERHLISLAVQVHFENPEQGKFNQSVSAMQYLVRAEYMHEILNYLSGDFTFFAGGGGIVGYEEIKNRLINDGGLITNQSGAVYGASAGCTAEKYLFPVARSNALYLIASLYYNYFFESQLGTHQINASIGVRYLW